MSSDNKGCTTDTQCELTSVHGDMEHVAASQHHQIVSQAERREGHTSGVGHCEGWD